MQVFFVCGAPKSGTTWLQRILDAHPEVCCSGEGHFVHRWAEPLSRLMNAYNRLLSVDAEALFDGEPVYPPIDQAEMDAVARPFVLGRLMSRAAPGVRWVGDKTPLYTHQLGSLNRLFPQSRIINIVRDPRDVAVSRMGHARRVGNLAAFDAGSDAHREAVQETVSNWIQAVRLVDAFAAAHPGRVFEVRYWELFEIPEATLSRLFGYLGVATDPALIRRIAAETSFEAMSGRKPGQEDAASFLRQGAPGGWRKHLEPAAAAAIEAACGELMRKKGVPSPRLAKAS